ncbi:NTF2-like domain-containing protein [Tanacetum coccineum]|uniref:NTF2-like domain-containing protein n=1 Tax=Tanacetum coccineum TaxID=301880 RepID=A0ABQ4WFK6_9ASTR
MAGANCFYTRLPLHLTQPQQTTVFLPIKTLSFYLKVLQRFRNGFRCSNETPGLLKAVVSGATEILRLFSSFNRNQLHEVVPEQKYDSSATCVDDIITILETDYGNAYFVTGNFTPEIYAEDCIFEDPTIRFSGRELYSRNLKLLVPFFENPSISLRNITKVLNGEREAVMASWGLRTYLKLPWRPLISIDGKTVYDLDNQFRIVKHVESWNVSPLEAIGQIFTPSSGIPD